MSIASLAQSHAHTVHELRTPLNAILGFSAVLGKNKAGNLSGQDLAYVQRIHENGKHLLMLVNSLLDLSKAQAGKSQPDRSSVQLKDLVETTLAQVADGLATERVAVTSQVVRGLEPIEADATRLRQILINLLGNALKFTEAGTITVWVAADDNGRPLRLDVIDTGTGIARDRQQAIFEAFEQEHDGVSGRYGGTGLGLAISAALARTMGYRLSVTSEPGQGATFSIHFDNDVRAATPDPALPALQAA